MVTVFYFNFPFSKFYRLLEIYLYIYSTQNESEKRLEACHFYNLNVFYRANNNSEPQ